MALNEKSEDARPWARLVGADASALLGAEAPPLLRDVPSVGFAKRALDLAVASAILLLGLPLFAAIAVAIRRDSPGPVLFSQERIGEDRRRGDAPPPGGVERRRRDAFGRPFRIWKFRTMRADASAYAPKPADPCDPRITPIGRFLRQSCLDELPQLLNVLRGEMTLVGPRPEMPFVVASYDAWLRRRLLARPGITGMWQLFGARELAIHESPEWDLYYLEHASFRLDLRIIAATIIFALRGKNQ